MDVVVNQLNEDSCKEKLDLFMRLTRTITIIFAQYVLSVNTLGMLGWRQWRSNTILQLSKDLNFIYIFRFKR